MTNDNRNIMSCLFCKIASKEIPSKIVYEDTTCLAFRDINPQAPTHILIIPRKHISKHAEVSLEDADLLVHLHQTAQSIAQKGGLKDYRLVINNGEGAGQTVWHLHLHLLGGRNFSWPPG